jgi:glycosyltransferase involved in cell wall biosynthesis
MLYLLNNEEERKRKGQLARRIVEHEFSWQTSAKRVIEIYRNILEGRKAL